MKQELEVDPIRAILDATRLQFFTLRMGVFLLLLIS